MAERNPSIAEQRLYWQVFRESLPDPYRIFITDDLGLQGRPWTSARWFRRPRSWSVNIGPKGYNNATQQILGGWGSRIDATFIHELVHVWQGYHSVFFDSYMFRSLALQVASDAAPHAVRAALAGGVGIGLAESDPYKYTPGDDWSQYNVEQKASIVEHWYVNGMKSSDPLFRYIKEHIWKGSD